jgi:3-hydroxyisobutyrate dehydrogenase
MGDAIGFVGLGVMGTPMAGHLADAGHTVTVFDIETSKIDAVCEAHANARRASSAREVAAASEVVFTMLPEGGFVRDVALGDNGLIHGFSGGELLVDTSSCEPWMTRETAAALEKIGVATVDAPTSGAEAGAKAAELVFMVGGGSADVDRARKYLDSLGRAIFHLGPLGSGHAMKSINNLITAMTFLATAEGLALGTKLGLDPNVMTDVMNLSTSMSWITRTHIKQRITNRAFDDAFRLDLMVKDIRIALGLAESEGLPMSLSAHGQRLYELASGAAGEGASVSELVRYVESATGVEIRPQTDRRPLAQNATTE